jgi:hypothetical protein
MASYNVPSIAHRGLWTTIMSDLILATHCHSCGASMNVALIGYCGQHCSKGCWSTNELILDEFVCPFGGYDSGCKICAHEFVTHVRSRRHRNVLSGWPMRCALSFNNETIKTREPIAVSHHCDE